jgi:hypothetical protein
MQKRCHRCNRALGVRATQAGSLADAFGTCALCRTELEAAVAKIGTEKPQPSKPDEK